MSRFIVYHAAFIFIIIYLSSLVTGLPEPSPKKIIPGRTTTISPFLYSIIFMFSAIYSGTCTRNTACVSVLFRNTSYELFLLLHETTVLCQLQKSSLLTGSIYSEPAKKKPCLLYIYSVFCYLHSGTSSETCLDNVTGMFSHCSFGYSILQISTTL